jgi:hypothetical protein
MRYSSKLNKFLFFKLPAAFICGVRVKKLDEKECSYRQAPLINQNPFNSMYFAVQAMAELSTGALVMYQIQKVVKNIDVSG